MNKLSSSPSLFSFIHPKYTGYNSVTMSIRVTLQKDSRTRQYWVVLITVRMISYKWMNKLGYYTALTASGNDALKQLRPIWLIFLDYLVCTSWLGLLDSLRYRFLMQVHVGKFHDLITVAYSPGESDLPTFFDTTTISFPATTAKTEIVLYCRVQTSVDLMF